MSMGFFAAGAMGQGGVISAGYPQILSVTNSAFSAAVNHNVAMPAACAPGDLLLAFVSSDGTALGGAPVTEPSGWTQASVLQGSASHRSTIFFRIADGSEGGATVNFATAGSEELSALVYRIEAGSHAGEIQASQSTAGSGTSHASPALSPGWGAAKTLWICAITIGGTTAPSAYPYASDQSHVPVGGASSAGCAAEIEAATVSPPAWATAFSDATIKATIAVRPA